MSMSGPIRFAALGVDHRHIVGMAQGMLDAGMQFHSFWTQGTPQPLAGFIRHFPGVPRVEDSRAILEDPRVSLVLLACPPDQRAAFAIEAMRHGKDVMTDKPGCITMGELEQLRLTVAETGNVTRAVKLTGIGATAGAKAAIEAAGGSLN